MTPLLPNEWPPTVGRKVKAKPLKAPHCGVSLSRVDVRLMLQGSKLPYAVEIYPQGSVRVHWR